MLTLVVARFTALMHRFDALVLRPKFKIAHNVKSTCLL